jgi:hypothetical protein
MPDAPVFAEGNGDYQARPGVERGAPEAQAERRPGQSGLLREQTTASLQWIADRLQMG